MTWIPYKNASDYLAFGEALSSMRKPNWKCSPNQSGPRTEPSLELHSRAASSVGVKSPFQQSQHRKQFRRKADKKWTHPCELNTEVVYWSGSHAFQVSNQQNTRFKKVFIYFNEHEKKIVLSNSFSHKEFWRNFFLLEARGWPPNWLSFLAMLLGGLGSLHLFAWPLGFEHHLEGGKSWIEVMIQ